MASSESTRDNTREGTEDSVAGGAEEATGDAQPLVGEAAVPEKLADDVVKPPLWKRVLYTIIPALEKGKSCIFK